MLSRQRRKALLLAILAYATSTAQAFQSTRSCCNGRPRALTSTINTAIPSTATVDAGVADAGVADADDDADDDADVAVKKVGKPSASGACYYKRADGPWKPRKELSKLKVGQRLFATRLTSRLVHSITTYLHACTLCLFTLDVQQYLMSNHHHIIMNSSDLMNGKTGPKGEHISFGNMIHIMHMIAHALTEYILNYTPLYQPCSFLRMWHRKNKRQRSMEHNKWYDASWS